MTTALLLGASTFASNVNAPIGDIVQWALADTYTATSGTVQTKTVIDDSEFDASLEWMYNTQITRYNTQETYAPFSMVTREQAAKMLAQFFGTYVENPPRIDISNCDFSDTTNADPTLKPYILDACQFSIFKGSAGMFAPGRTITKAELSAALIRMFSDGQLDETVTPWWTNYFIKAQQLGLTKETNINNFQNSVSRYELALILHRFKKIYVDEEPVSPLVPDSQIGLSGSTVVTGTTTNNPDSVLNLIGEGANATDDIEFREAVWWMYDNGLTKFTGAAWFAAFDVLTREQAAKMLVQYRNLMFPNKTVVTPDSCVFADITSADPTLSGWIAQSCKLSILKGWDGYFAPTKPLTRAEAIAVLLRMFDQPQNESVIPRWSNYFTKANELGLINEASDVNFNKSITRYEMATLMYRLRVKNKLVQSLNSDLMKNQLITMVNNNGKNLIVSTGDWERGYILMNTYLLDQNNDYFLIDVFGTTYKIEKNTVHKYYDKQYVRYGDIYTLDGTTKVGIANFMVNDTTVIEGVIRPYGEGKPSYGVWPTTPPYYIIKQIVPLQPWYLNTQNNTTTTTTGGTTNTTGSTTTGSSIQ